MKKSSLMSVVALATLMLMPAVASAEHRFGTDRGSRYHGGSYRGSSYHGGHGFRSSSRSHFGISIGFGSGGYHRGGYSYTNLHFGRSPSYYRGGYTRYYPPVYSAPVYCPPPVVYAPAPSVIYAPPPAVVYYPSPRPVYTSSYYYSSGGYYCGR